MYARFTKTAERRYRVSVEGPDVVASYMDPATGYDALLPHDALLSEQMVYVSCNRWQNKIAKAPSIAGFRAADLERVCREFDAASAVWSRLDIGESMTLVWHGRRCRGKN